MEPGMRPGDWQGKLWKGIAAVPAEDTLIHLGDVCIGGDEDVHLRLQESQCKKVLVLGNHDTKSKQWYEQRGWHFVCDGIELIYMGERLFLSHCPLPPSNRYTRNVHGHTHGDSHRAEESIQWYDPSYHKDLSPELAGYTPLRLDTLVKCWKKAASDGE